MQAFRCILSSHVKSGRRLPISAFLRRHWMGSMSRKAILRVTGLVLAVCCGVALGQLAGVLTTTQKAIVATGSMLNAARDVTVEVVAPSDNVIDWQAEPSTPRPRPRSAR